MRLCTCIMELGNRNYNVLKWMYEDIMLENMRSNKLKWHLSMETRCPS